MFKIIWFLLHALVRVIFNSVRGMPSECFEAVKSLPRNLQACFEFFVLGVTPSNRHMANAALCAVSSPSLHREYLLRTSPHQKRPDSTFSHSSSSPSSVFQRVLHRYSDSRNRKEFQNDATHRRKVSKARSPMVRGRNKEDPSSSCSSYSSDYSQCSDIDERNDGDDEVSSAAPAGTTTDGKIKKGFQHKQQLKSPSPQQANRNPLSTGGSPGGNIAVSSASSAAIELKRRSDVGSTVLPPCGAVLLSPFFHSPSGSNTQFASSGRQGMQSEAYSWGSTLAVPQEEETSDAATASKGNVRGGGGISGGDAGFGGDEHLHNDFSVPKTSLPLQPQHRRRQSLSEAPNCERIASPISSHYYRGIIPNNAKKILVVDLDDTLVCAGTNPNKYACPYSYAEAVPTASGAELTYLWLRPHARLFLNVVSRWYRLAVFTAASDSYATVVASRLDPQSRLLTKRFSRRDCTPLLKVLPEKNADAGGIVFAEGYLPSSRRKVVTTSQVTTLTRASTQCATDDKAANVCPLSSPSDSDTRLRVSLDQTAHAGYTKDLLLISRKCQLPPGSSSLGTKQSKQERIKSANSIISGGTSTSSLPGAMDMTKDNHLLENIVLMDNEHYSFWLQPENGLYLPPFVLPTCSPTTQKSEEKTDINRSSKTMSPDGHIKNEDDSLLAVLPLLEALAHLRDVRTVLHRQRHVEPIKRQQMKAQSLVLV